MTRASFHFRMGDVLAAEADAAAALAVDSRDAVAIPAVGALVSALAEQDRFDEASGLLAEHGLADDIPGFRHGTVALLARARLREARGEPEAALADYREMRRRLDRTGRENVVGLDGRVATALLLRALDRSDEAEREAAAALDAARRWGTPGAVGTALHALGVVRDDVGQVREATELLAQSPFRLRQAKALLDLGSMLRRAGKRSESREPLREALALADAGGAARVRERAREELAASGVRVQRAALSGADSLTPSERRIAERAAAGASNPQIAQELFVTVKTVEMHLSNAYRKLEISGRRDLARALSGP
jgi:DNA-binding CsgD family transcriptional regulator